jgi:hypothetical protein
LKVTKAYTPSFKEFPMVRKGEEVRFIKEEEKHPGWFIGVDRKNVKGYFPTQWFQKSEGGKCQALKDYDAKEIDVEVGDEARILIEYCGWVRVETKSFSGWIPRYCIYRE